MNNVSVSNSSNMAKTVGSQGNNLTNHFGRDSALPGSGSQKKEKMNQPGDTSTDQRRESFPEMNSTGPENSLKRRADDESVIDSSTADYTKENIESFMALINFALAMDVPRSWLDTLLEAKTKIEPDYKKRKFQ